MAIKKFDVTGDPTPDNTAGGTNGETDRPASSKAIFDGLAGKANGTMSITVSETPPSVPSTGDLWVDIS